MDYVHLIVAQIDRQGYQCSGRGGCGAFHRRGEPLYVAHAPHMSSEGVSFWTETQVLGIDHAAGQVVRLPAALGLAALRAAGSVEG